MTQGGRALDPEMRSLFEPALRADLGGVRLHTGSAAASSARALRARAYAAGADIVFAAGAYRPESTSGRELIAHELVHTVQQSRTGAARIQRQEQPDAEAEEMAPSPSPDAFALPGGMTLFPGEAGLHNILGMPLRLPGSLRLTNALGLGPGPGFVLDLSPETLVLAMLNRIDLSASPTAGAAPGHLDDPDQQARVSLVKPVLRLDTRTGKIIGFATLRVPSGYPLTLSTPTELDVRIESTDLGRFSGSIALGPLHADMSVKLKYDVGRLNTAVSSALTPRVGLEAFRNRLNGILLQLVPGIRLSPLQDTLTSLIRAVANRTLPAVEMAGRVADLVAESLPIETGIQVLRVAVLALARELSHPGFSVEGTLGLDLPGGLTLPLSTYRAEAPTTVPLDRPLLGAPAAFPLTTSAGGVIIAPPGAISDIAVPALGYNYSSFGSGSGTSITAATLPTLSPTALSTPSATFSEKFPVYAFAELTHVRRLSDTIDAGVRVTVQFSTPDLTGRTETPEGDINAQIQQNIRQFQEGSTPGSKPPVPNIGFTVFGNF